MSDPAVRAGRNQASPAVRAAVEDALGDRVVTTKPATAGFTSGVVTGLTTRGGRRAFLKAIGPDSGPVGVHVYRREARTARSLPVAVPAPRLPEWQRRSATGLAWLQRRRSAAGDP